jgi:hypothetical protein
MPKALDEADLNRLYTDADSAHRSLLAEQRSNVLLVAGNHYSRRGTEYWRRIRHNKSLSGNQKLRLTKNHIQKITKTYINNIVSHAPGVRIVPKNKSEFADQKSAELHNSVWQDMKKRHNLDRFFHMQAKDFIELGESWAKIFFDPEEGQHLGVEEEVDDDGNVKKRKDGESVVLNNFTGDVTFERIFGFNVLTDPGARSWDECRYVIYRKMVDMKDLKEQFEDRPDLQDKIVESSKGTFQLFEGHGGYRQSTEKQTEIRETYWKPSPEYPNGYYWIGTETAILFKGELPHGLFPICHVGFDEASTSARSFSIIKQLRPYQAEINRAASKIAETQITFDDKIVTQTGGSVSAGGIIHGLKHVRSSGPITYLPGRAGDQYLSYLQFQIEQMYFAGNVAEDSAQKGQQNLEPYTLLFRSMREKKQFSLYAQKFECFIKEVAFKALTYAKKNYSSKMVIQVIDKKDRVNIDEFKSEDDLGFEIALEEVTDDIESMMGQQIALNHVLQFAGDKLSAEDAGQIISSMPLINDKNMLGDLTIDYDNFKSDVVSMDNGKFVPAEATDNHEYYVKKLTNRIKMKDFDFLPDPVKSNYDIKLRQHQQFLEQQMQDAAAATAGFIPSGGFLVTTDIRVPRADDPSKNERAKVPVEALAWLIERLEKQGQSQALFQSIPESSQADIGQTMALQAAGPQSPGPQG